jgi:hypothetical protein
MFTFRKDGTFDAAYQISVADAHTKTGLSVPLIESGPHAGKPRAQEEWAKPAYDASTHRLGSPTPDGKWEIVALTEAELAAKVVAAADAADKEDFRKAVDKLDAIIAAQSMNAAQVLAACQLFAKGFKRVLKDHYQG